MGGIEKTERETMDLSFAQKKKKLEWITDGMDQNTT